MTHAIYIYQFSNRLDSGVEEFRCKYNWKFDSRGSKTHCSGLKSVNWQLVLGVL